MRETTEQWGCSYVTGFVVDPDDVEHLQSKVIIRSNEFGITTFTIFNRSTGQDESLVVDAANNMWKLRTEPSYASSTPAIGAIVAHGGLDESPESMSIIKNTMVAPIQPALSKWIGSQPLLDGVAAVSPLMKQMILHMREAEDQWGTSYLTGLVVDPNDGKHVQSKVIIRSNEFEITTFTIFNRERVSNPPSQGAEPVLKCGYGSSDERSHGKTTDARRDLADCGGVCNQRHATE
jgi:hypothetical protein